MKKILLGFLSFGFLIFLVTFLKLSLIINNTTVTWLARYLSHSAHITMTWKESKVEITSLSFLKRRLSLAFSDFCIDGPQITLKSCVPRLQIALSFKFAKPLLKV